jgi:hypothetical protein
MEHVIPIARLTENTCQPLTIPVTRIIADVTAASPIAVSIAVNAGTGLACLGLSGGSGFSRSRIDLARSWSWRRTARNHARAALRPCLPSSLGTSMSRRDQPAKPRLVMVVANSNAPRVPENSGPSRASPAKGSEIKTIAHDAETVAATPAKKPTSGAIGIPASRWEGCATACNSQPPASGFGHQNSLQ